MSSELGTASTYESAHHADVSETAAKQKERILGLRKLCGKQHTLVKLLIIDAMPCRCVRDCGQAEGAHLGPARDKLQAPTALMDSIAINQAICCAGVSEIVAKQKERIWALRSELAAVAKDRDSLRRQVQQLLGGQVR